jgi:ATP-dependent protease HslVU (ClpYQ) peptidase subunit
VTTIACDGKSMAGDGQSEACGTIVSAQAHKVHRLADGSLFGMAGAKEDRGPVVEWMENGGRKPKVQRLTALLLRPDGALLYFNETLNPSSVDAPCAVGSGMDFAIGAMEAGLDPERALEIASRRDPNTGGKITVLHLEAALSVVEAA